MIGWWDPTYWLFVAPALIFMVFAQWRVRSAYGKWSQIGNTRRISGVEAARQLLSEAGLSGAVGFNEVAGELSDSYDPSRKVLNLSKGTALGTSVASLAIVAHELGHVEQDFKGLALMKLRTGIIPAVNFGSRLGPILLFAGFFINFTPLVWLGIGLFSLSFVFTLITLPIEIDASNRAMRMLTSSGLLMDNKEQNGARAVLTAAALTYVASMLIAFFQLLYYIARAQGRGRRS